MEARFRLLAVFLGFTIVLLTPSARCVYADILFSDNFDDQEDWNMSQSSSLLTGGWTQKLGQNRGGNFEVGYINATGAHGGSGKGFVQYWDRTGQYGSAQDCWLSISPFNWPNEWYFGYWLQFDPNWNWNGPDQQISSFKLWKIHFNNGENWGVGWQNFFAYCPAASWSPPYNPPPGCGHALATDEGGRNWAGCWNDLGGEWHYYIWHVNHSTGFLGVTIDGVDVMQTQNATDFPGTGWDSGYGLSFGGNVTDGGGGISEMWSKYDDVVIATTLAEVEEFLGVDGNPDPPPDPPENVEAIPVTEPPGE